LDTEGKLRLVILAIDPSHRRGGGALLGDRIRMNAIDTPQVFFRSVATRGSQSEVPPLIPSIIDACRAAGFDLVIVETPGIGQGDAAIVDIADVSLYVMTPEYGAPSQLEKIDMLDLADVVAINKFDRRGADDALRAVSRQWTRNHSDTRSTGRPGSPASNHPPPVFGTIASRFNDLGTTALYQHLRDALAEHQLPVFGGQLAAVDVQASVAGSAIVPPERTRYLAEIAETVRGYHAATQQQAEVARRIQQLEAVAGLVAARDGVTDDSPTGERSGASRVLEAMAVESHDELDPANRALLAELASLRETFAGDESTVDSADGGWSVPLSTTSLSGTRIPRVALPRGTDHGDLLGWLRSEHLPGHFPFTAGVFPLKRENEDPARMFAGEGDAFRTNRRFHLLAAGQPATRLSTAFDSVTLYGRDPDTRPDVYGKVGTSGVSIATLDDMKALYAGFDLCDPTTSVSMTINGPAPTILAMYLNTAIDQQLERFEEDHHRAPTEAESEDVRQRVFRTVRGTVQADILKEDQGQNTCIFSTEFSLGVMADIQEFFVDHQVRNFYSVSISGYHIAEAGANPITQLAFTLANGFTYVESYLARGLTIDDFAPNLSFFFSNGMDPEYTVMG
ncbi:MAG: methylmalonyl-CoA mutase family protein, partial [Acidimicrobiales bacterium]